MLNTTSVNIFASIYNVYIAYCNYSTLSAAVSSVTNPVSKYRFKIQPLAFWLFKKSKIFSFRRIAVVTQDGGTTRLYAPEMWYKRIMHSALIETTVLQQSLTNLLAQLHCKQTACMLGSALRQHHKTKSGPTPCGAPS